MKKLLLSATVCLSIVASVKAQNVIPCGTTEAREYFLKNLPGYAAQINANESKSRADYETYLQNLNAAKTSSAEVTYTIPVVFHVLHNGEPVGTGDNVPDALCANSLIQVNKDYARLGNDTTSIDPRFDSLYKNIRIQFVLAQKDPMGNCTNGIVRHQDPNTQWKQSDLFNYKYSTYNPMSWNPNKYLNIYIVGNIISSGSVVGGGIIVGYTYKPGTAPVPAADAIVYRNDFLVGLNARSLSHEIGHWLGLGHTFGDTNSPGFECGNDDIDDTPATTGFFSTCPKVGTYNTIPTVTTPADSSDILEVRMGDLSTLGNIKLGALKNTTALNSNVGNMIHSLFTMVGTTVTPVSDTSSYIAKGTAGSYSDFSNVYGNDFNANTTKVISVTSSATYTDNNYVGVFIDYNRDGDFMDGGESVLQTTAAVTGVQTHTVSHTIPSSAYALYRMRVVTSNIPITNNVTSLTTGEFEDYNINIGTTPSATNAPVNKTMATCDTVRPNIENIMDYSSCPKNFTVGQKTKMRGILNSSTAGRDNLVSTSNLQFTGILDANGNPVAGSPCAPIADFTINKMSTCAGQAIMYTNTSFNGTGISLNWEFEGGNPSTSTAAVPTVTYSNPGTYSVSLTATNAEGVSTKTISNVTVNWNAGPLTLPYSENFESGQWWPNGWEVTPNSNDANTPTWELSQYGADSSNYSLCLPNANTMATFPGYENTIDYILTPSFDFSNVSNISFTFDYSFARKTGVTLDTFKVQYSLDCGGTWKLFPGSPNAASMAAATGGTVNAPYIPWAVSSNTATTQWANASIPSVGTNQIANKRDVRIRFWFKNDPSMGASQNLYLDNINISGTVGVAEFENMIDLSIYPNPTSSSATVDFTPPHNSKAAISVFDVTGRVVEKADVNANAGVSSKYIVNSSDNLKAGIYFISISIGNDRVVKKVIIN